MALEDLTPTHSDDLPTVVDDTHASHQRSPRTDPSMRDGDSAHGNPNETAVDQFTTDNDTGDVADEPAVAGFDGGVIEGTSADLRADAGTTTDFTLRDDVQGDALDVMDDEAPPADGADVLPRPDAGDTSDEGLPIRGYDRLTVKDAIEQARSLSQEQLKQLRDFEAAHRNRKTLIARFDRMMSGGRGE
jgi:hypothetical protein